MLEIDRVGLGVLFDVVEWILFHVSFNRRVVDRLAKDLGNEQVGRFGVLYRLGHGVLAEFPLDSSQGHDKRRLSS